MSDRLKRVADAIATEAKSMAAADFEDVAEGYLRLARAALAVVDGDNETAGGGVASESQPPAKDLGLAADAPSPASAPADVEALREPLRKEIAKQLRSIGQDHFTAVGNADAEAERRIVDAAVRGALAALSRPASGDVEALREALRPLFDAITPVDGSMPDLAQVQVEAERVWAALSRPAADGEEYADHPPMIDNSATAKPGEAVFDIDEQPADERVCVACEQPIGEGQRWTDGPHGLVHWQHRPVALALAVSPGSSAEDNVITAEEIFAECKVAKPASPGSSGGEQLTPKQAKALYEAAWRDGDVHWNPDFDKAAYDEGLTALRRLAGGVEAER